MAEDKKIELLSPARDMEQLEMSLTYGADAVYLAGKRFGLRASAGNFGSGELRTASEMCKQYGARMYVACNSVMNNDDVRDLPGFFGELADAGADAVIVSDIGALALCKKYAPCLDIHISTQAGVFNYETSSMLYDLGASRVILARELPLSEIARIRENAPPDLELEAFVHGGMCVSISGRCLLSNYLTGRDANRGDCAQPCRWKFALVEQTRPGEYFEISEDGGTYIMNSRDLCMLEHIGDVISAGVTSLKIEGRMKSAYYAACVTNAYRHAVDAALTNTPLKPVWREEINKISHREYGTGFYYNAEGPGQYHGSAMYFSSCTVMAIVESCDEHGNAVLTQRNRFFAGDELELVTPRDEPVKFTADALFSDDGTPLENVPHPMMRFRLKLPFYAPKNSILRKYNS